MHDSDTAVKPGKKRRLDALAFFEIVIGVIVLAFLAVVIAGFLPLSFPTLARSAEKVVRNSGVDSCSIQSVSVALWKGVTFNHVMVAHRIDSQTALVVRAPECAFYGNLAKVAFGFYRNEALSLTRGGGKRVIAGKRLAQFKNAIATVIELSLFRKFTVSRATIEVNRTSGVPIVANGISVECAIDRDITGLLQGSLSAGSLSVAGVQAARNMSATFSGDTNTLTLSDCRGTALDGKVRCACSLDLDRERIAAFTLSVKNLDLGEWRRWGDTTKGYVVGRADMNVTLDSSDLLPDSLRGKGDLSIAHFSMTGFTFQKTLATMFAFPHFARPRFDKVEADFSIQPGGVLSARAQGRGDTLTVTTNGWIRIDSTLDESITCEFSKAGVRALPEFMRKTLDETKHGGLAFKCRIFGKVGNPKFAIESQQILQKAVQNLFDNVRNNLQQWLR